MKTLWGTSTKTLWGVVAAFMILLVAASPALAEGPQPGTLPANGYDGISAGGAKAGKQARAAKAAEFTGQAPEGLGSVPQSPSLVLYGWTNLMRQGGTGTNSGNWGCYYANDVCSQGWTTTNQNVYYLRSGNYLCRSGSCTSYTYRGAYSTHWVWAGWRWNTTSWTSWFTYTQHYYNYGSGTYTKYTSLSQIF